MNRRAAGTGLALALMLAANSGCGSTSTSTPGLSGSLSIDAATSLTGAFRAEQTAFMAAHPGTRVVMNFAASSTLARQINEGAPEIGLFASADLANMNRVASLLAAPARTFARNRMMIVVRPGNPQLIQGLADLLRPGLTISLCAPAVPCGGYARQVFLRAGLAAPAASQEPDVLGVLSRVRSGEADAGIVYSTDVAAAAPAVSGVAIPDSINVTAAYPVGVLRSAPNPALASAFADFLLSANGQAILARFGFVGP